MKRLSFFTTLLFISLISLIWYKQHTNYKPNTKELFNKQAIDTFLENIDLNGVSTIPTGLYIESLKFVSANDVYVSGIIWQKYHNKNLDDIGVRFPNAVEHFKIDEIYREKQADYLTVGWSFEANLRQSFNYLDYPLDHKSIWIKLLPRNFNNQKVLVPDLNSYKDTSLKASFGIVPDIVLGGWDIDETYFDYIELDRGSNLGLKNLQKKIPQLTFNIVIKRQFISAFIINMTLMLVSISLLFSFILMMTKDEKKLPIFALKLPSTISACAGIFLAILLAHISIRERFETSNFIYIESFYFLAYFYILSTVLAHYLFATKEQEQQHKILSKDATYLKHLYWPVYFGLMLLFTVVHFYL